MGKTWKHSELGTFTFDEMDWVTPVGVPGFKSFVYRSGGKKAKAIEVELTFETEDATETPSAVAVALAKKTLANASSLAPEIIEALWDDFNGRGPKSGMWWSDGLDELGDGMEDADPPAQADDLYGLMRPYLIRVCKEVERYRKPVVEIRFHAAFEEEHGVGVLTDGEAILGLGYGADVTPFKVPRKKK